MAKMIKTNVEALQYPALMKVNYLSIDMGKVGGDNTTAECVAWSNFHDNNGKCFNFANETDSDATNLGNITNTLKSVDEKLARNFQ